MPKKQPTKKQHYVPQIYLKGFSVDQNSVYEYNLRRMDVIDHPVSIESVCREQYMYELRNQAGDIINVNYIENILCGYEGQFADYCRRLLCKATNKKNYETHCFLTTEEKDFWLFYTALQLVRNPITLNGMKGILKDELQHVISDQEAYNKAIEMCLPFFKKPEPGDMNPFLFLISVLKTKILTVGYAESDHLFTSEHAMCGVRNSAESMIDFKSLWFPVSSNCVLLFAGPNFIGRTKKNCLIPISEERVNEINKGIAYIANQAIFSKYPFSEADIQLIEEARKERAEDEKRKSL